MCGMHTIAGWKSPKTQSHVHYKKSWVKPFGGHPCTSGQASSYIYGKVELAS